MPPPEVIDLLDSGDEKGDLNRLGEARGESSPDCLFDFASSLEELELEVQNVKQDLSGLYEDLESIQRKISERQGYLSVCQEELGRRRSRKNLENETIENIMGHSSSVMFDPKGTFEWDAEVDRVLEG
eukprot:jgi/Bigna1/75743/fgenesh1_pg.36_\